MSLTPGTRLGPYEVVSAIGAGGMGEVYRATDTKLKRQVAIKILPPSLAADHDRLGRFQREAEVLASLNHPNIAAIHGLEESDGVKAIVMELIEGPTLADRITRGPIPVDEALPIAKQIAEALEAAHDQGIIHRDLKPANIKVRPDGTVKVLDFGLAKALEPAGSSSPSVSMSPTITTPAMTEQGMILGTAAYMSPEQAKGRRVDKRADIWAFGCVIYEMLTGQRTFAADDVSDTLAAVLRQDIDWTALPTSTPSSVQRLISRCLDRDVRQRLRDIGEARIVLSDSSPGSTIVPVVAKAQSTKRVAWAVAALACVAFVVVLAILVARRPPPTPVELSQFVLLPPEKTSFTSDLRAQAISPDGRRVVFVAARDDGTSQLWIRSLHALPAHALPGTDGATLPFWSPDSKAIGFFAAGKLRRIDMAGGPAQDLADVSAPWGGTWSREGVILFAAGIGTPLFRVPAGGGSVTQVTTLDQTAPGFHVAPSFLPDGRHFLFRVLTGPTTGDVYVGSLESKDVKQVLRGTAASYAPPGYLLYVRESMLMAQPFDTDQFTTSGEAAPVTDSVGSTYGIPGVTVSESGTLLYRSATAAQTRLAWVDRAGQPRGIAAPPGAYGNVALSPDDTRVAFDRLGSSGIDVWLMDLDRRITSRLTRRPRINNVPIWSPDGRIVAFASARDEGLDIYQRPSNESGQEEPVLELHAQPIVFPSDWSSDRKYLMYYRTDPRTQLDLWVLPFGGDRTPLPLLHGDFNESQGQFSPDDRWIAYVSDESGAPQVYVQSFPALAEKRQVSISGGTQPRWRRDGRELFYLAPDRKLMAVTVKAGAKGTGIHAEVPRTLFETALDSAALRQTYSVAADGQRFLLNSPVDTAAPPMTIVLNWPLLLKRQSQ